MIAELIYVGASIEVIAAAFVARRLYIFRTFRHVDGKIVGKVEQDGAAAPIVEYRVEEKSYRVTGGTYTTATVRIGAPALVLVHRADARRALLADGSMFKLVPIILSAVGVFCVLFGIWGKP